jgi:hypothetical protein
LQRGPLVSGTIPCVSALPVTYTFKKRAYWFDARGLDGAIEQAAREKGVQLSLLSRTRKRLTVTMEFTATGSADAIDDFREAVRPHYWKAVVYAPGGDGAPPSF